MDDLKRNWSSDMTKLLTMKWVPWRERPIQSWCQLVDWGTNFSTLRTAFFHNFHLVRLFIKFSLSAVFRFSFFCSHFRWRCRVEFKIFLCPIARCREERVNVDQTLNRFSNLYRTAINLLSRWAWAVIDFVISHIKPSRLASLWRVKQSNKMFFPPRDKRRKSEWKSGHMRRGRKIAQ